MIITGKRMDIGIDKEGKANGHVVYVQMLFPKESSRHIGHISTLR